MGVFFYHFCCMLLKNRSPTKVARPLKTFTSISKAAAKKKPRAERGFE